MVTQRQKRRVLSGFLSDTSGLAMTEMLIIFPVFMVIVGAMIEFGALMFQWNQTVKGMQLGARLAAVSTPLTDISSLNSFETAVSQGDPTPNEALAISCGAGTTACDATELGRLLNGGDACGAFTTGLVGVCDVAPFIGAENLRVTYYRSGLGYVGRPFGPVLSITLEVRNLNFDFFLLDDLIPGLGQIAIPAHPVTITSEDMSSCADPEDCEA
ncbi:hypothetical protein AYJ57_25165 (plasmid) [Salipiger sp. CCB-MM3]|uniref:TadE/TadG family type IV pilus assembly protein n=1 Tax=Salipiger sp. CCB-MM3 TaxID=1792508 RepID=UPI00080A9E85|nr:TadE/TadG family type IV pilus assembly protein [Salipiger sp. CCB-MM3]ANT63763.1 hypothetical protein AYJ57_25165 [Salipiger sp. CCB-MM3]